METPLRKQHEDAGATLGVYFDCLLPERFTDVAAECNMARESVALLDTNYHAFVYFEGPDRARYLNAMLTNNVKDLRVGQGCASLLLNPQGHILAEIETYAEEDKLLTLSHASVRERTVATLEKFIIMDDVTLDDATERLGSIALEGPRASGLLRELCSLDLSALPPFAQAEASIAAIPCRVIRRSLFGEAGVEIIVERGFMGTLWEKLFEAVRTRAGGPIGYAAYNVLRLEAGVPWFGYDFNDKVIPHEAALESSHISFSKGCYTGQEIIERVRSRGHVNRRRAELQFAGAALPEAGAKLFADGKDAGHVTSAAHSPALSRIIGMGYVRREYHSPGSRLEWAGGEAEVVALPFKPLTQTQARS